MHTNLSGHGLFGFRDNANFKFGPVNFPFAPYYAFSAIAQLVPIPCIHSLIAVSAVSVLVFVLLSIKPRPSRMRSRSAPPTEHVLTHEEDAG